MSDDWRSLAIEQTIKTINKLQTDNRRCLVCKSFNKGKRGQQRCRSPFFHNSICPATEMCQKYVKLLSEFAGKFGKHLNELKEGGGL